jgi:hypothetical protein
MGCGCNKLPWMSLFVACLGFRHGNLVKKCVEYKGFEEVCEKEMPSNRADNTNIQLVIL